MIVHVDVGGRIRRVELNQRQDGWDVTIDARRVAVDVERIRQWSSLIVDEAGPAEAGPHGAGAPAEAGAGSVAGAIIRRPNASYEIAIDDRGRGELIVHVDGAAIPVAIVDLGRMRAREGAVAGGGPAQILSPMPGRIVKVLVKPGDQVLARQGLVVVEAMKMENELRAPGDARVVDVRVKEGMSVEARTVLIVLE